MVRTQRPLLKPMLFLGLILLPLAAITHSEEALRETAIFAGGCFWCVESAFDKLDGVISTTSGYTGGQKNNPTYKQVSGGETGHAEAVEIVYDPSKISYTALLDVFWKNIDPTTPDRQFCDLGNQYRTAIFYLTEEQKRLAEASRDTLAKNKPFKEAIVTDIVAASAFYPAEDYHQDYYLKNRYRYKLYRYACRRDQRLEELWGVPGMTKKPDVP